MICMGCGEWLPSGTTECKHCHSRDIQEFKEGTHFLGKDYFDVCKVTKNPYLRKELLELKSSDPAEYQRRMSQMQPLPKTPYSSKPTVKCPYCGGYNCQKISGMSKAVSIGLWGLFSGKIGKQWHCNGCGSDF